MRGKERRGVERRGDGKFIKERSERGGSEKRGKERREIREEGRKGTRILGIKFPFGSSSTPLQPSPLPIRGEGNSTVIQLKLKTSCLLSLTFPPSEFTKSDDIISPLVIPVDRQFCALLERESILRSGRHKTN